MTTGQIIQMTILAVYLIVLVVVGKKQQDR